MNEHEQYMQQAISLATENVRTGRGGPFGALIVRGGRVIAAAANAVTRTNDPTAHAEVNAIREACRALGTYDLRGATLYSSCEPCPMCLAAALWARVDGLYYGATAEDAAAAGFDDRYFYEQVRLPAAMRDLRSENVMRSAAAESFQAWHEFAARVEY